MFSHTVTALFLFRCIPDSLFPYFNFCWSATVSPGVFPRSVHIYRRPWSMEACSDVQRYGMKLDYVPLAPELHQGMGQEHFSVPLVFLLNYIILYQTP